MAVIYLVRHGQASFGKDNYDELSELGHQQAEMVGHSLAAKTRAPNVVITGTMLRHKQTADKALQAFGDGIGASTISSPDWNEYDHQAILGAFDARLATPASTKQYLADATNPKQQFMLMFESAIARWMSGEFDGDYPESWSAFKQRVHGGLNTLSEQLQSQQKAFVFTSGGPISLISQACLGVNDTELMRMNRTLVNCGITKIVLSKGKPYLASLNEHTAFEGDDLREFLTYT
ncbi:histidine phosphatase family protein [Paraneptunicella aestuarii]|uniref:histidine phosphatase family protein n=1 Tax=Paraneptunicella aestuarii TaxID=2831148 RepID=UPI001E40480D|nr:histidine phosphatase family protein [Paraneptunicella aestuarii]UAA37655.1 histidine phosphatase family protein [Paraneptunicella aestuarii]